MELLDLELLLTQLDRLGKHGLELQVVEELGEKSIRCIIYPADNTKLRKVECVGEWFAPNDLDRDGYLTEIVNQIFNAMRIVCGWVTPLNYISLHTQIAQPYIDALNYIIDNNLTLSFHYYNNNNIVTYMLRVHDHNNFSEIGKFATGDIKWVDSLPSVVETFKKQWGTQMSTPPVITTLSDIQIDMLGAMTNWQTLEANTVSLNGYLNGSIPFYRHDIMPLIEQDLIEVVHVQGQSTFYGLTQKGIEAARWQGAI